MEYIKDVSTGVFEAVKEHVQMSQEGQFWWLFSIVTFLLIAPWGADFWLQANSLLMLGQGISILLFPQWWAKQFVDGQTDSLQHYEMCCMGAMAITQGLTYFMLQKSADKTVKTSLLWAMTLEFAAVIPLDLNYTLNPGKGDSRIKPEMVSIDGHMAVLWFATSAVYALMDQDWGGYSEPFTMKRNIHLRIDFMINLTNGLLAYVLPTVVAKFQTNLKALNVVHVYLARVMGVGMIQMAISSGRASNFLKEGDKKMLLFSHVLCYFHLLVIMLLFQFFTSTFSGYHALFGMVMVSLSLANAAMGCDLRNTLKDCWMCTKKYLKIKSE